jgi:hypothetical protein
MGFFKFIRQNDDVQKPKEQENVIKNVTIPQTPVFPDATKPEVGTPQSLPQNEKKQKNDACDFFNVKIYDIFSHQPEFIEKTKSGNGKLVEKFTLKLNEPELSTFNLLNVFRYENGNYDLVFTGNEMQIKTDLIDFIHYCVNVLGADFMQKKEFSQEDVRDMRLGIFSRVWHGQARIENIRFRLSLTLYNITPQTF